MNDFFYGDREPSYLVNHDRHTPYYSQSHYTLPYGHAGGHMAPVVELLVPMCCNKCEEKIRENMVELRGVRGVIVDRQTQRVTVSGFVDPLKALKKAKKVNTNSRILSGASYSPTPDYLAPRKLHRPYDLPYDSEYRSSYNQYTGPSKYRTSYSQYAPSYGHSSVHPFRPASYSDGYSPVITNPHYLKHIESEYY